MTPKGAGRPRTREEIRKLAVRMAKENPSWGYTRIQGDLSNVGHVVGRTTVARILKEHGIEPAPERGRHMPWSTFLRSHWDVMEQVARNTTDVFSGFLREKGYPIIDRDPRYTKEFRVIIEESGVEIVRTPPRSPNLNAYAERFVRSIKEECLSRMIFFSEEQLRRAVREYVEYYHAERNHQGIGNRLIELAGQKDAAGGEVVRESRLGGLLNHHRRAA